MLTHANTSGLPLAGTTVLVVEDEPDLRDLLVVTLEDAGATALGASGARDGLRILAERSVSVIVSDIGMPDVDGYAFIAQVRRDPRTVRIPAVAYTAFGGAEDRWRALAAGYEKHLAKPADPAQLVAMVAALVRGRTVH